MRLSTRVFSSQGIGVGASNEKIIGDYVAGEVVNTLRVVYALNCKVFIADESNLSHVSKVIGVSLASAVLDENVKILEFGKIKDDSFSFVPGESVFLSSLGQFTQNTLGLQNVLKVGRALAASELFLDIEPMIVRI